MQFSLEKDMQEMVKYFIGFFNKMTIIQVGLRNYKYSLKRVKENTAEYTEKTYHWDII